MPKRSSKLVRFYWLVAFLAIAVVALGLWGVLDGEQTVKVLLGLIALMQGAKEAIRESRNDDEKGGGDGSR